MQITTIGLGLAKHWFQVHGVEPMETATMDIRAGAGSASALMNATCAAVASSRRPRSAVPLERTDSWSSFFWGLLGLLLIVLLVTYWFRPDGPA